MELDPARGVWFPRTLALVGAAVPAELGGEGEQSPVPNAHVFSEISVAVTLNPRRSKNPRAAALCDETSARSCFSPRA